MRTRTIKLLFLSAVSAVLITSCNHSSGGFETDSKTGVIYHFIKHDESGAKGADSDFAKVVMEYSMPGKDGKDSELFNSHKKGMGDSTGNLMQAIPLKKTFNGCLEQALLMMSAGDSAEFQINADSLFLKTFHATPDRLPPGVTGTTIYTFRIKLTKFMTKKELNDERQKQMQKYMEKMQARKGMEAASIAEYIKSNHYENVKPTEDSIFYLEREKGKGKEVKDGDSLEVAYKGMLLDGTIFDQSKDNQTFKLLYSKTASVIQGWIKVLGTMHEGEKVKVLLPSSMAYGQRGAGQVIAAYSPLVFDIQVLRVKSN